MNQNKIRKSERKVETFLQEIENPQRKADSQEIFHMMSEITKIEPKMWGDRMIGFGDYHYRYKSGREGDYFRIGFSPTKQNLTLYLLDGMAGHDAYADELQKLGKHKTGKSCLYISKLDQIDLKVLRTIIEKSFKSMNDLVANTEGWH
ncbi:MAG: DUF1801 domain-containing protein [Promethearchaeota archaeon]